MAEKDRRNLFEHAADECIAWSEAEREHPWWTPSYWRCRYRAHRCRVAARRLAPFYEWRPSRRTQGGV